MTMLRLWMLGCCAGVLLFAAACRQPAPSPEDETVTSRRPRTLAALEELVRPDLTHQELLAAWGEPDARGSGRDLRTYKLDDSTEVTFFFIGRQLISVVHTLARYPRAE